MKKGDAFPSSYLGKDDLYEPVTAVISDVRLEEIAGGAGSEDKPVMHFEGGTKSLVLNATNWNTLEAVYGEDTDDWRGRAVELYIDPGVVYAGKRVGGVRVRVPSNGRRAAPAGGDDVWSWKEALERAAAEGIDQASLTAALRDVGCTAYRPSRDTKAVKQLIANAEADIPF